MRGWVGLLAAISGCGDGRTTGVDSGVGVDAQGGLVTVRVMERADRSSSVAGLEVFFQYPDSQLALATRTLDDGSANAYMREPGFVTVIESPSLFWTFAGAKPGDELILGEPAPSPLVSDIRIKIPSVPDAAQYTLHTSCTIPELTSVNVTGAVQAELMIPINDCNDGRIDLLLLAKREFQAAADHFIYRPNVTFVPDQLITITGPYQPAASTIRLVNVPPRIGYVAIRQELIGNAPVYDSQQFGDSLVFVADGEGSITAPMPHPPGATIVSYLDDLGTFPRAGLDHVIEWGPSLPATTVDMGLDPLFPFIAAPTWDPTSNTIIWRQSMLGTVPESVVGQVVFGAPFEIPQLIWNVTAAFNYDATGESRLRIPVLPRVALQPPAAPVTSSITTLRSGRGYDHDRLRLFRWRQGGRWPIDASSGRVSYQTLNESIR